MILLIDNYDSFTHNLARYLKKHTKEQLEIVKNDHLSLGSLTDYSPSALVISPGPSNPQHSGCSIAAIKYFADKIPILGVCLGHQCIAYAYGASIIRAPQIYHGKTSAVTHLQDPIFTAIPTEFRVARYHSLMVDENTLPTSLKVIATSDNIVMALRHETDPIYGIQYHPEAFLTEHGDQLIKNFVSMI